MLTTNVCCAEFCFIFKRFDLDGRSSASSEGLARTTVWVVEGDLVGWGEIFGFGGSFGGIFFLDEPEHASRDVFFTVVVTFSLVSPLNITQHTIIKWLFWSNFNQQPGNNCGCPYRSIRNSENQLWVKSPISRPWTDDESQSLLDGASALGPTAHCCFFQADTVDK